MTRTPFAVLLVVLLARTASAMNPEAERRLERGVQLYEQGHYARAIAEYQAAYAIDPDPQLLIAWAQAERLAGRCEAAIPRYRRYLGTSPSEEGVRLAETGIDLCEAAGAGGGELPWYKNKLGGVVLTGVASLTVGTAFLISASGVRDEADHATTSDQFDALLDRATTRRRIGAMFLVVGTGLAGGGIVYHLLTRPKRTERIAVSTDGRSLFIAGSF